MKLIPIALLLAAVSAPTTLRAQTEPAADLADTLRAVDMAAVDALPSLADRAEVARALAALYPESLKASGVSGTVKVRLVVDARGRALAPRVAEASGHAALDSAALRAAEGMRFVPARRGGEPQPVWVELPITFVAPVPGAEAAADSAGSHLPEEYDASLGEELPRLANPGKVSREVMLAYPPVLKHQGVPGAVTLRLRVDTLGMATEAVVVRSTAPEFAAAAMQVVRHMRFTPGRVGGVKVWVWVTQAIYFEPMAGGAERRSAPPAPERLGRSPAPASRIVRRREGGEVRRIIASRDLSPRREPFSIHE